MIKTLDFELVVQKSDGSIYHPPVKSFSTVDGIPFENSPEASIQVISSSALPELQTVSLIEFDDIVRLRGCSRFHPKETPVYVDIFEGRVQNMHKASLDGNTVSLECVGHINEAFETLETIEHTWTNTDAKIILQTLMGEGHKLSRVEFLSAYIDSGIIEPEYNVKAEQMYMSDVLQELETVSGKKWFFDTKQFYSGFGVLLHSYLTWKHLPETPTQKYQVVEGSNRLISATVDVIGEDVKTYRYVKGGTSEAGYQYHGDASDSEAVAKYGPRYGTDTFTWVESDSLCTEIAKGLVGDSKDPYISIQATLEGTLDAHKGDLVPVDFRTLDIKGVTITGNYTNATVRHQLSESGEFTTTLDLGRTKLDEHEYLYKYVTKIARTAYKNQTSAYSVSVLDGGTP